MRSLRRALSISALVFSGVTLALGYQNCGGNFQPMQSSNAALGGAVIPDSPNGPGLPVMPTPTPSSTPTPTASKTLAKTEFYLGHGSSIDRLELDHTTGVLSKLPSVAYAGNVPGWMSYDAKSKTLVAVDAGSTTRLDLFDVADDTGSLTFRGFRNFVSGVVHLMLVPQASGFKIFGENYDRALLSYYTLSEDQATLTSVQSVQFADGGKAHSSAYDPTRQMLFVATLGLNLIHAYKVEATGLIKVGEISVIQPRTVVFDEIFDKLYVSTEAYTGNSFIKGYALTAAGVAFSAVGVASLVTPISGADLKVNHVYRYVMANAREAGKQSINGMPVTATGTLDATRPAFSIPLTQVQPRSLEVTADGRYALVAMNSAGAENVVAFRMTFDANLQFVSSEKIFEQKVANDGYVSALSIPRYKD